MKSKPKGAKYRNLTLRGGVIYYERLAHGRRFRISAKTNDWDDAASFRDAFEAHEKIGRVPFFAGEVPPFAEFARRYLAEDTSHLAPTTLQDRKLILRADGPVLRTLGAMRLDALTPALLREWWNLEVTARGRSTKTGRSYLDAVASVLGYAMDLGIIEASPVGAFREALHRRTRTKRGRSESEVGRHVRPIEAPDDLRSNQDGSAVW